MKINVILFLLSGSVLFSIMCKNESSDIKFPDPKKDPCDSIRYSIHIKPIIATECAINIGCHGVGSGTGDFTLYASLLPYIKSGSLRDHVLIIGDMPKGGSKLQPKQLDNFKCWLDKGGLNN